ncbi:hypothetical protein [Prescottella equi]|uniref:hypothetical protein n=1 Tax=Rhodococcus hoagii TaxID=43767 RepID=UPI00131AD074|nr:hypothetical protein [Prescottella equi]
MTATFNLVTADEADFAALREQADADQAELVRIGAEGTDAEVRAARLPESVATLAVALDSSRPAAAIRRELDDRLELSKLVTLLRRSGELDGIA